MRNVFDRAPIPLETLPLLAVKIELPQAANTLALAPLFYLAWCHLAVIADPVELTRVEPR